MKTLDMYLNEQLQDDAFRQEWEENQPEMDIIRAMRLLVPPAWQNNPDMDPDALRRT
mgnify:CR=1 FL=1